MSLELTVSQKVYTVEFTIGSVAVPPTDGGAFTGTLSLTNINGSYHDDYDVATSGAITFVAATSPVIWGFDYVRIISDGTTAFATDANFKSVFTDISPVISQYTDYKLPAGTYEMYFWKTPKGVSISTMGMITVDTTKPVITLTGASTINLTVGDTYNELGATATDNVDGDITADIVITGTVDTAIAATYTKYYNVQDAAGNYAIEVTRSIVVSSGADTTPPAKMTITNITLT